MGKRRWKYSAGEWGCNRVAVEERTPGGILYARTFDPKLRAGKGGYRSVSLKHRDQEQAKIFALQTAAKLKQGGEDIRVGRLSVGRLFALYAVHRIPRKTPREQTQDRRRCVLWARLLGPEKDAARITRAELENFCDRRATGELSAQGESVADASKRVPVRPRAVEKDVQWLGHCLNWACGWQDTQGRFLLAANPLRGFHPPTEDNPRRPVASTDRLEKVLAAAETLETEIMWSGIPVRQRAYLADILTIAAETGRRISAVLGLRWQDVLWERGPHGSIRWQAATDKQNKEWTAPLSPRARATLDRIRAERPGLGAAYLFPSPIDAARPTGYERVRHWLLRAEERAGVVKQGGCFHPYRRAWATARKHLPLPDVAAAGGWRSTAVLLRHYQHPDDKTMLAVVLGGAELRERQA
jgi:integrase